MQPNKGKWKIQPIVTQQLLFYRKGFKTDATVDGFFLDSYFLLYLQRNPNFFQKVCYLIQKALWHMC